MNDITTSILTAWSHIKPHLQSHPHALAARLARRRLPVLTRPPRAWCLAIRASDHRLPAPVQHSSFSIQHYSSSASPHEITLTSQLLRRLTAPVHLDGRTPHDHVAAQLGTTSVGLRRARIKNVFNVRHIPGLAGRRGRPVPLLFTDAALDPNAPLFAPPDRAWLGTADADRIPAGLHVTLTRIAHFRPHVSRHAFDENRHPEIDPVPARRPSQKLPPPEPDIMAWYKWSRSGHFLGDDPTNWRNSPEDLGERPRRDRQRYKAKPKPRPSRSAGSLHFNGYFWLCPHCQKTCRTIYYPLPPMNLLSTKDIPRLAQIIDIPRKIDGFACRRCHRVKFFSRLQSEAWNDLIAYMTAGLLYGREVPRPAWFTPDRKRPYKPMPNRSAPKREQVLERLLKGWPRTRIAADLGMTAGALSQQMWKIFKQHRVRTYAALLRKHDKPLPPNLQLRRHRVLHHLKSGHSQAEIAKAMGITKQAVQSYISQLRKHAEYARPPRKRATVARLLAQGLSPREIAQEMGLSVQNVYDHMHELRRAGERQGVIIHH
jgi:DNA-binding NarL/FixJ family response regulator